MRQCLLHKWHGWRPQIWDNQVFPKQRFQISHARHSYVGKNVSKHKTKRKCKTQNTKCYFQRTGSKLSFLASWDTTPQILTWKLLQGSCSWKLNSIHFATARYCTLHTVPGVLLPLPTAGQDDGCAHQAHHFAWFEHNMTLWTLKLNCASGPPNKNTAHKVNQPNPSKFLF